MADFCLWPSCCLCLPVSYVHPCWPVLFSSLAGSRPLVKKCSIERSVKHIPGCRSDQNTDTIQTGRQGKEKTDLWEWYAYKYSISCIKHKKFYPQTHDTVSSSVFPHVFSSGLKTSRKTEKTLSFNYTSTGFASKWCMAAGFLCGRIVIVSKKASVNTKGVGAQRCESTQAVCFIIPRF